VRVMARNLGLLGAASATLVSSAATWAQSTTPDTATTLAPLASDDVAAFYDTYKPQPIWTRNGINEAAVGRLVAILQRAPFDGFPEGPLLLTDWGPTNTGWFRSGREHK